LCRTLLGAQLLEAGLKNCKYDLESVSKHQLEGVTSLTRIEMIRDLARYQFTKLKDEKLYDAARLEFSCIPAVVEMDLNGVLLDIEKWKILGDELSGQKDQHEKALRKELGPINLDSPQELLKALQSKGIVI
jgi:DNA polymerase I-like protein with 3'-5' exonuclease and polymerase domains